MITWDFKVRKDGEVYRHFTTDESHTSVTVLTSPGTSLVEERSEFDGLYKQILRHMSSHGLEEIKVSKVVS